MARKSRVVINRAALDEVTGGLADGVFDITRAILRVSEADAPDAEPYGEGLVMRGGAVTFVGRKRVHQVRTDGQSTNILKPKGSRGVTGDERAGQILGLVGWGFPAMFLEFGTVHAAPHPFFTAAVSEVVGSEAEILLSKAMQRRLRGERDPKSAEIGARIAAARAAKAARNAGGGT